MLINLKTANGRELVVNPSYITNIETVINMPTAKSELWVVSQSGYGTKGHCMQEEPFELHKLIDKLIKQESKKK